MSDHRVCRLCENFPTKLVCDLGKSPPANNFIEDYKETEILSYPLELEFCRNCFNLQLSECLNENLLYSNYNYLTPDSKILSSHYQELANYINHKIGKINKLSILEIGSNNGLLLKHLSKNAMHVLGVDPAENVAKIANEGGIETINDFFNINIVKEIQNKKRNIDVLIARHMFAHNKRPHDILEAAAALFDEKAGYLVIENAYALDTLLHGEFDQIYHEHMYFYTVTAMMHFLNEFGFKLFDISFSSVHGGSVVFYASSKIKSKSDLLEKQLKFEAEIFSSDEVFKNFCKKISALKDNILFKIKEFKDKNLPVIAYGAPAKAFTMFSFFNLDSSSIKYCVDTTATKQGKTFPVSFIPIVSENDIDNSTNKLILVNAWNYKDEIIKKSSRIFKSGDLLLFPLPNLEEFKVR